MTTDVDIAWAAGLFEGEGCIYWQARSNNHGQASLQIRMTDLDVLTKFVDIVQCGKIFSRDYDQASNSKKRVYKWNVQVRDDVIKVLNMLLPYLGERRTEKALEIFDNIEKSILTRTGGILINN